MVGTTLPPGGPTCHFHHDRSFKVISRRATVIFNCLMALAVAAGEVNSAARVVIEVTNSQQQKRHVYLTDNFNPAGDFQ